MKTSDGTDMPCGPNLLPHLGLAAAGSRAEVPALVRQANQRRHWRPLLPLPAPGGATTSLANLKKSQLAPPAGVKGNVHALDSKADGGISRWPLTCWPRRRGAAIVCSSSEIACQTEGPASCLQSARGVQLRPPRCPRRPPRSRRPACHREAPARPEFPPVVGARPLHRALLRSSKGLHSTHGPQDKLWAAQPLGSPRARRAQRRWRGCMCEGLSRTSRKPAWLKLPALHPLPWFAGT